MEEEKDLDIFRQLISRNEFGEAKDLAIRLQLSDEIVADAIRLKKTETFEGIKNHWQWQLTHDCFWGTEKGKNGTSN